MIGQKHNGPWSFNLPLLGFDELVVERDHQRLERDRLAAARGAIDDAQRGARDGIAEQHVEVLDQIAVGEAAVVGAESRAAHERLRHAAAGFHAVEQLAEGGHLGGAARARVHLVVGVEELARDADAAPLVAAATLQRIGGAGDEISAEALAARHDVVADGVARALHFSDHFAQQRIFPLGARLLAGCIELARGGERFVLDPEQQALRSITQILARIIRDGKTRQGILDAILPAHEIAGRLLIQRQHAGLRAVGAEARA